MPLQSMNAHSHERRMTMYLRLLLGIGFAVLIGTIGAYYLKFGLGQGGELSGSAADWNNFGGFVGGVAGPCFGFMAFLAAIETILMQARQMDEIKRQGNIDELQRALATMADRVDRWLERDPDDAAELERSVQPRSLLELLTSAATPIIYPPAPSSGDELGSTDWCGKAHLVVANYSPEFSELRGRVDDMAWCLQRYIERNGSADVVDLYLKRYQRIAGFMHAVDLIPDSSRTYVVFAIAKTDAARPQAAQLIKGEEGQGGA